MIYRHDDFGDEKVYSLCSSWGAGFTIREFNNGSKKTELTLSAEEKIMFETKLKENGWYAND